LRQMFKVVPHRVRWIIYLSSFMSIAFGYLIVAISAYLPEVGVSSSDVGLIMGVTGLTSVVCAIPIGLLADRIGRKSIFILGSLVVPPCILVYAFTYEVPYLLLSGAIAGISEGAFMGTWNALIADQTDVKQRNAAFSLSFIYGNVSFGIGFALPMVFPAMQDLTGLSSATLHTWSFAAVSLLAVITPVSMWILLRDYTESMAKKERLVRGENFRPLMKFSLANSLIGLGAGFIIPLIPTWLWLKYGIPDAYSGPLLAVSNITIGIAAIGSAVLARKYGIVPSIVLTAGTATAFMLGINFMPNALLACSLYLVRSALMNMGSPLLDSFLMGIVTKEERGLASAINAIVWRLPNSVTTIVGGAMLASGDYDTPFYLAAGFYAVSLTLFYIMFKDVRPSE